MPHKGLKEGVLHVQGLHIPSETWGGWGQDGPLLEQILLEWAGMGPGEERWPLPGVSGCAQYCPGINPHCQSRDGWGSVLHVFQNAGHNRRHKSVSRAQKRATKMAIWPENA